MSVSRSTARCLLSRVTPTSHASSLSGASSSVARSSIHPSRSFSNTVSQAKRHRPHYASLKASDKQKLESAASQFKSYTDAEKQALAEKYTPEQMEAIEAAEASIDPRDIATQMKFRLDTARLDYLDDLSTISPVLDKRPRTELEEKRMTEDPGVWPKTEEEMADGFRQWTERTIKKHEQLTQEAAAKGEAEPIGLDWDVELAKYLEDPRSMFHAKNEEALLNPVSSLAPEIPKGWNEPDDGNEELERNEQDNEEKDSFEADPIMLRVMQRTGLSSGQIKRLRVKQLVCHRVVNQTRMGKIGRLYFLTIAGDGNGMLGIGEGKSAEPEDGRRIAIAQAIQNLKPIPRYEKRTIYGEVKGKVGATELTLSSRPPGFGLRTQHLIFEVARAAGIHDLHARVTRARNPMNTVKACYQALMNQRIPEDIARGRGRKLVDVRKVYYNGNVY